MDTSNTNHDRHDLMRAAVLVAVVLCTPYTTHAQNLVPNPGFEEADNCSDQLPPFVGIHDWYSVNGSPDHLRSCLPYGDFRGLPMNFFTYQEPFEGASCAGMYTYWQNDQAEYREWIMAPLLEPMVVGQTYYTSFRANAAFGGTETNPQHWLANDKVGMRFATAAMPPWNVGDPFPVPPNQAHMIHPQILADTVGWTLVSGSFVADSAYQYVMIGQFFSNDLTDTLHFADPNSVFLWYPRAYTLVDAVCVSGNPCGCDLGQGVGEVQESGHVLFPNPAKDQLSLGQRAGAVVQVLDVAGRMLWQGQITSDRWVLDVGSWARGAYVLHMAHGGHVESYKFVLTE
ncbi:MAG: T9SS type A sorting domain-containing protein [Flavobacteriales bacterium]